MRKLHQIQEIFWAESNGRQWECKRKASCFHAMFWLSLTLYKADNLKPAPGTSPTERPSQPKARLWCLSVTLEKHVVTLSGALLGLMCLTNLCCPIHPLIYPKEQSSARVMGSVLWGCGCQHQQEGRWTCHCTGTTHDPMTGSVGAQLYMPSWRRWGGSGTFCWEAAFKICHKSKTKSLKLLSEICLGHHPFSGSKCCIFP